MPDTAQPAFFIPRGALLATRGLRLSQARAQTSNPACVIHASNGRVEALGTPVAFQRAGTSLRTSLN
jgi:hypothetical protein